MTDRTADEVIAEARDRIYGLVDHGAHICSRFVPQSEIPVSCKRCGYMAEVHMIRDLVDLVSRQPQEPEERIINCVRHVYSSHAPGIVVPELAADSHQQEPPPTILDHWQLEERPPIAAFDHAVDVANENYRRAKSLDRLRLDALSAQWQRERERDEAIARAEAAEAALVAAEGRPPEQ